MTTRHYLVTLDVPPGVTDSNVKALINEAVHACGKEVSRGRVTKRLRDCQDGTYVKWKPSALTLAERGAQPE